jgi:hypothetical protein
MKIHLIWTVIFQAGQQTADTCLTLNDVVTHDQIHLREIGEITDISTLARANATFFKARGFSLQ